METTTRLLLPEVQEALRSNPEELVELTEELHPADLADLATALEPDLVERLLQILPVEVSARLLEFAGEAHRVELFEHLARGSIPAAAAVTDEMAADDRADLYAELPGELRQKLLDAMSDEESRDVRRLLAFEEREDTAGALLTTDFVALPATSTAAEAIELVRLDAAEMETIYQAYAVDPNGTLLGVVSLRDLVTAPARRTLDQIMNPNVVFVQVDDDQEDVARQMAKYDLLAIPVVDSNHHIVGIITVDDVIDVVQEEATEDAQKMGAVEPLELPYMSTPVWGLVRARAPWLVTLFIAALATENVLSHYSDTGLESIIMLLWFVPLIISSGGNSGSQSATLIIRAMALDGIRGRDTARVLRKEVLCGLLLGVMLAFVGIARLFVESGTRTIEWALAIGLAVLSVVTLGALVGAGVPLLLRRLGIDPAVSSTPFVASVLDIAGLIVYFEIATLFLP